jgi:hypothetical protein
VTSPEQKSPHSVERDNPDTDVIEVSAASPVFVDATGRRRRLLRRLTFAFGGLLMVYGGLISVSLAGGPVSSSSILPLPDREEKTTNPQPNATPTPAATTPAAQPIIEALPRHVVPATRHDAPRRSTPVATRPPTPPAPPKVAPTPSASTSKPVESTSSPAASPSPSASGSTAATPAPNRPPAPRPPSVSASVAATGESDSDTGAESGDETDGVSAAPAPFAVDTDLDDASPTPEPSPLPRNSVTIQVST